MASTDIPVVSSFAWTKVEDSTELLTAKELAHLEFNGGQFPLEGQKHFWNEMEPACKSLVPYTMKEIWNALPKADPADLEDTVVIYRNRYMVRVKKRDVSLRYFIKRLMNN